MRVQLAQQAQEILGTSDLVMITERVDDVALLIGQMVTMGLPEVLDRHIPRHWTQRGLSWGWTAVIWLASIVTEGDHRKVSVETYLKGMHHTLSHLTAQVIEPLAFRDDRLSHLLTHLSKPAYWHQIEQDLNVCSIEVYDLRQEVIRCDATTVSGDHEVTADGLLQFGHSKDDPTRPQLKVLMGSLAPLGMPLSTDVVSGERADDGFSYSQNIRTHLSAGGYAPYQCLRSTCFQLHHSSYSASRGTAKVEGSGDGLETPAGIYHGDGRSGTAATQCVSRHRKSHAATPDQRSCTAE